MRATLAIMMTLVATNAFAKVDGVQFIDCFKKATSEVISEMKAEGKTKGICETLPEKSLAEIIGVFSEINPVTGDLDYISAEDLGEVTARNVYEAIKNKVECFKGSVKGGGLVPGILNTGSYHRNLSLTERALTKMIGVKLFSNKGHKELSKLDLSYCSQE